MSDKILIYRRGSIGDAIISIPALNHLRRLVPHGDLRILTNQPVMERAAPLESIFENTPFCNGIYTLPPGGGSFFDIWDARKKIRLWGPDRLVYLSEPSSPLKLAREYMFFRSCGIRYFTAFPVGRSLRTYHEIATLRWEPEHARLLRAVSAAREDVPDWTYEFDAEKSKEADSILATWPGRHHFLAMSIGAKLPDKDWGDKNRGSVLDQLAAHDSSLGIMAIGAGEEKDRIGALLDDWPGPMLNLCGATSPVTSAMAMRTAKFYLGHDSGPMHLAALTGLRCVAVFSARAKPGVWFPHGGGHEVLYPWHEADAVPPKTGLRTAGGSILSITVDDVVGACMKVLSCAA